MKTKNFHALPIIALLIKWSGIGITDGRNKIGGTVLSKSRSGATARNKVTPINRRTSFQSAVRAVFTGFSQAFSNLTTAQITAWNNAAANGFTLTNIFGDSVKKSGKALYVGLNTNLQSVGVAPISDPPSSSDVPAVMTTFAPIALVGAGQLFTPITFNGGSNVVPADSAILVYATPKLSRGVSFVKSQYRLIAETDAGQNTSTVNLLGAYVQRFGGLPAVGDNIRVLVQVVNKVSGISGTPWNQGLAINA